LFIVRRVAYRRVYIVYRCYRRVATMHKPLLIRYGRKLLSMQFRNISDRLPIGTALFTVDSKAMDEHSDVIMSHIKARGANSSIEAEIQNIAQLRKKRAELTKLVDDHRRRRKLISSEIATCMKSKDTEKADLLKKEVEVLKQNIADIDSSVAGIEVEMDTALLAIPNLLDDRYVKK
jgi:hypothetical protein